MRYYSKGICIIINKVCMHVYCIDVKFRKCNMATKNLHQKADKIVELFTKMSYESKDEDLQLFRKWKASHQPLDELSILDFNAQRSRSCDIIEEPTERTVLLQKFANLIETSLELICQMGANSNIQKEDTNKSMHVFLDYLRFYAMRPMVLDDSYCKDDVLCFFAAYVYPGLLGMVLGPILALGHSITIATNNQLDFCVLLSELAIEAGYPDGTIVVLNVEETVTTEYIERNVLNRAVHFGYDNICDSNYMRIRRLLNIVYGKIPFIVFDSADQQSACHVLIEAVWSYNGQLPWSADTVFVQENIWDSFITKLKCAINQHSSNFALNQNQSSEINQMLSDAKNRGIEIYQDENGIGFAVFIGQRVYESNVIKTNTNIGPTLTVLPFRTLNEGAALANNTRQGIAASVWGENICQVNEVARQLQVGTVWINSFGVFKPEVSFMPWKESGYGYFGGFNGLFEYQVKNIPIFHFRQMNNINSIYSIATFSQTSWAKIGYANRSKMLIKLLDALKQLNSNTLSWISAIYESFISTSANSLLHSDFNEFDFRSIKEPIGIVAIEDFASVRGSEIMFKSLLMGNVVILVKSRDENANSILSVLIEQFPQGVINIIKRINKFNLVAYKKNFVLFPKDINVCMEKNARSMCIDEKSADLYLTREKNIWTSIGQTYC